MCSGVGRGRGRRVFHRFRPGGELVRWNEKGRRVERYEKSLTESDDGGAAIAMRAGGRFS